MLPKISQWRTERPFCMLELLIAESATPTPNGGSNALAGGDEQLRSAATPTSRVGRWPCRVCGGAGQGGLGPARRRRAGGGGTTFPARARPVGITTSVPSRVRTAKDPAPACSRMPSTSVICLLSPGPGRQRITTRLPTSAGVSRTTSRYRMPVTYSQGGGPDCRAAGHRATADAATIRYLTHGHGGVTGW